MLYWYTKNFVALLWPKFYKLKLSTLEDAGHSKSILGHLDVMISWLAAQKARRKILAEVTKSSQHIPLCSVGIYPIVLS